MNILETENLIKGLPDERLFTEAQNPTGQVPQFLVISEIQRRTDMRKRFKNQDQEMPQGTVSDQIINEGIGSMDPPRVPSPLPQGPGIVQGQQYPPQTFGANPNAEIAPRYAGGGIVSMQDGGIAPDPVAMARQAANPININALTRRVGENVAKPIWMINRLRNLLQGTDRFYTGPETLEPATQALEPATQSFSTKELEQLRAEQIVEEAALGQRNLLAFESEISEPDVSEVTDIVGTDGGITTLNSAIIESGKDPQVQARKSIQVQGTGGFNIEDMIAEQRKDAWSNALIQLGAGIAGNDLAGGLARAGAAGMEGKQAARQLAMAKIRQDFFTEREEKRQESVFNDPVLARSFTKESIAAARKDHDAALLEPRLDLEQKGSPADVITAEWFLSLPEDKQAQVLKFKGRDTDETFVREFVANAVKAEREAGNEITIDFLKEQRRLAEDYIKQREDVINPPGSSKENPIDEAALTSTPPPGAWVRLKDGTVKQIR